MKYDHNMKVECECDECGGTGVYIGMAEKNGSAVVCNWCKGTGKVTQTFQWNDFKAKKKNPDVKKVYAHNCGFCLGVNPKTKHWTEGGMDYKDWFAGTPFPEKFELRSITCPDWYYQGLCSDMKPDWDECAPCGSFSDCEHFKDKDKCWARFDAERKKK